MFIRSAIASCLSAFALFAAEVPPVSTPQPPVVEGLQLVIEAPKSVDVGDMIELKVTGADRVRWAVVPANRNFRDADGGKRAFLPGYPPGATYQFVCAGANDKEVDLVTWTVTVKGVGPVPPGPTPDPTPPIPPGPPGMRVLILEDEQKRGQLDRSQQLVLGGTKVKEYLRSHVAKSDDGKTLEYRQWDATAYKHDDFKWTPAGWEDRYFKAIQDSKGKLPWILIVNGGKGTSEPLPMTEDATIELLKRYEAN